MDGITDGITQPVCAAASGQALPDSRRVLKKISRWFTHTERAMLQSTEGKKLSACTDTELKQTLAYCCLMVGITKPPAEDQKMLIVAFLKKYYGSLTRSQAAHAFEMLASGQLNDKLQEHYNVISPMYISGVLRAYMHQFMDVKGRLEGRLKEESASRRTPKSTPADYYNTLIRVVEQQNVIPLFWAWDEVHQHLCNTQGTHFANAPTSPDKQKAAVITYLKNKYPGAVIQRLG